MQRIQEHEGLFEVLEPRLLLTAFVVDTLADTHDANPGDGIAVDVNGDVSLRAVIEEGNFANYDYTSDITFDAGLFDSGPASIILDGEELLITDRVRIYGPGADMLTIDGNGTSRVFNISFIRNSVIEGVTITGGRADRGAGILVDKRYDSLLMVNDCVITGNTATGAGDKLGGGAIFVDEEGTVRLTNTVVSGNTSDVDTNHGGGGGIHTYKGKVYLTDSTVSDNWTSVKGGGIYSYGGIVSLTNSTVSQNTSMGSGTNFSGGGIFMQTGEVTLTDSSVTDNVAAKDGGGFYVKGGSLTITGGEVSGNTGRYDVGIDVVDGELVTNGVTVSGHAGKGIDNTGNATIIQSVIVGNHDGIYNSGTMTVTNSTVVSNASQGIDNDSGTLTINNSIAWMNAGGNVEGTGFTGSHNLIGIDPGFVANPDDGGDGWGDDPATTGVDESANDDLGDLHLTETSAAVNSGHNSLAVDADGVALETDANGFARVVFSVVDMGAYELQEGTIPTGDVPSAVVTSLSDIVDPDDELITLREALIYDKTIGLGGMITFAPGLPGHTIVLSLGMLVVDHEVTIDASTVGGITIDAEGSSRVFKVDGGDASLTLDWITITGGYDDVEGGAGVYVDQGSLVLIDSEVSGNSAGSQAGGGIYISNGSLNIQDSVLSDNDSANGGGVYASGGTVVIADSTILRNQSTGLGGGVLVDSGNLEMTHSEVLGNTADDGGGIHATNSTAAMINSVIAGNAADQGGGIDATGSDVTITNSTIAGNKASLGDGGGIITSGGQLWIYNSIVSLNEAPQSAGDPDITATYQGDYNLVGVDPKFVSNPSAGVDGIWGTSDDDYGDLGLTEESFDAVNQGNNGYAVDADGVPIESDLGGYERIYDYTVDLGAYEYGSVIGGDPGNDPPDTEGRHYIVTSLADVIANDGLVTLVEALEAANTNTAVTGDVLAGSDVYSDLITFDESLFASGARTFDPDGYLTINDDLVLFGPGENLLTLVTALKVEAEAEAVEISRMAISGVGEGGGSGVANDSTGLVMNDVTLTQFGGYTGTALINRGNVVMNGCTVEENSWSGWGNPIYGPPPLYAIFNGGGEMTIIESTIANNIGGGILNSSGDVRIIDSILIDGEGIVNEGSSNTIVEGSIIKHNDGSAIINRSGTTSVVGSELTGNERGLYVSGGYAMVSNSVIVGNDSSRNGGGILVDVDGEVLVTNSTITHNVAEDDGGGIYVASGGILTVNNSIVWNNQDSGGASDIVGSYTGTANLIGVDPLFVRNPSKGPDGQWGTIYDDYGDLQLQETSDAIDQGDNSLATGLLGRPLKADIAGMERIANGTVDIGAYEYGSVPYVEDPNGGDPSDTSVHYVVNSLLDVVADDGLVTLREAMLAANGNTAVTADVVAGSDIEVDQISFDPALFTGGAVTILLSHGNMAITESLDIVGPTGQGLLTIDAQELSQLFAITGSDTAVSISDLTLSNGLGANGGAISATDSVLTLTNVILTNNTTVDGGYGGGVYVSGGELIATGSSFIDDEAYLGGGIYIANGEALLTDCLISGSTATGYQETNEGKGGGIYSLNSNVTVGGSTVWGNLAALAFRSYSNTPYPGKGGGIYTEGGQLMVVDSQVSGNDANLGGGIYVNGSAEIHDSVINGNETFLSYDAGGRGGGIYAVGTLIIDNTEIYGNYGDYDGGGLFMGSGELTMSNSSVRSNLANRGGGLYGFGTITISDSEFIYNQTWHTMGESDTAGLYNNGNMTLTNVVVAANVSENNHGGIYNAGTLTLIHCTVAGNAAMSNDTGPSNSVSGIKSIGVLHMTNTIVALNEGVNFEGNLTTDIHNLIGIDPGFVERPTYSGGWEVTLGDLHLQPGSPAIDAGLGDASLPATDIEGNARHDDPDVADTGSGDPTFVDIGAYEAQYPIEDADFNDDGVVGLLDLDILGANWGMASGATNADGDANGDGMVGLLDLDCLGALWGTSTAMSVTEGSAALWWTMDDGDDGFDAVAEAPTLLLDEEEEIVTLF